MDFATKLSALMAEKKYTNYRLSKEIGCHPTTITNWLNGTDPQFLYLEKLSQIFNVSLDYLQGKTDDRGAKKEAPVEIDERDKEVFDELMKNAQKSVLLQMFAELSESDQYDVIYELLARKRAQQGRGNQK